MSTLTDELSTSLVDAPSVNVELPTKIDRFDKYWLKFILPIS